VVWPENASDIDPLDQRGRGASIDVAATAIGVPILVGGLLEGPGENLRNVGIVWQPGTGPDAMYVKQHPVPFAEYMPLRKIARMVTGEGDLVRTTSSPGTRPACCARPGHGRRRDLLRGRLRQHRPGHRDRRAQIITVQTNNATFNAARRAAAGDGPAARGRARPLGVDGLNGRCVRVCVATGEVHDATGFDVPAVIIRTYRFRQVVPLLRGSGRLPSLFSSFWPWPRSSWRFGWGGGGRRRAARNPTRPRWRGGRQRERSGGQGYPGVGRVLVVIPTYNEADNVRIIVDRLRRAVPAAEVLIADDNSPDGTATSPTSSPPRTPRARAAPAGKQGLGARTWRLRLGRGAGFDVAVEMDADGSHQPSTCRRSSTPWRTTTSCSARGTCAAARWSTGPPPVLLSRRRQPLRATGPRHAGQGRHGRVPGVPDAGLDKIDVDTVSSQGYCFQIDLAWRTQRNGFRVAEVPITFVERERGASKMSSSIVREALVRVTIWGVQARTRSLGRLLTGRRREA
jgi:apolipoprotein N-acyltransferase